MPRRTNKLAALKSINVGYAATPEKSWQRNDLYPTITQKSELYNQFSIPPIHNQIHPYARKFTVRKMANSEQRRHKSSNRSGMLPKEPLDSTFEASILKQIAESIDLKSNKHLKGLRMHTEKLVSPAYRLQANYDSAIVAVPCKETTKAGQYPFLTKFQKEQILRYQIHFIGERRIGSLKDFTNPTCEAKVVIGDAIIYRYEILSLLGQGSFGQVFKAYDHKKKEHVALKIIRNEPKFNKQAKVEIRILENVIINDPKFRSNIVQLKHAFFFRGHACLVFELLHINLYEFLKQVKFVGLSLDLIRRISIQILHGLQFLTRFGIIHCDLKPENILLKQPNKTGIKIIDVGSGCYQSEQIYTYIQSRFYRAPEIILGITYTCAIDIWSLGCILCELYLGYPLFPGESEAEEILMFMEVIGMPSEDFIKRGSRTNRFFEGGYAKIKPNSKGKIRKPNTRPLEKLLDNSDRGFIDFVRKFLVWEPEQRIKPHQALLEPWITSGLSEEIRKHHLASIKSAMHQ